MARGVKRAASKGKRANPVAKKCAVIAPAIKAADSLPQPVRAIIADRLALTFGTYKEDRHELQKTISSLVGQTLKATESDLQKVISDAEANKASVDAEGSRLDAANNAAVESSNAAASAAAERKDALGKCRSDVAAAKAHKHDTETAIATNAENTTDTNNKKDRVTDLMTGCFKAVKEGTLDKGLGSVASKAGKTLGRDFPDSIENEFLVCVVRTFSKAAAEWGTFDHIVDKELDAKLQEISAGLDSELSRLATEKDTNASTLEAAAAAVAAAEARTTEAETALAEANNAAKEAKAAATAATAALKQQQKAIEKSASSLQEAQGVLDSFQKGAMSAYLEVEAHTAPPEPPAPVEESVAPAASVAPLEQAMTAAPPQATQSSPGILPSPGVLLTRAASAIGSRLGASPRIASSPGA